MVRCTIGRGFTLVLFTIVSILLFTILTDYNRPPQNYVSPLHFMRKVKAFKPLQKGLPVLNQSTVNGIKKFLFFIGYPRSGHSIVASCVDAHPDAVIAHEFNLFAKLLHPQAHKFIENRTILYSSLYQNSYKQSLMGWRSERQKYVGKKGYTLQLNSSASWQGKFRRLRVIGDKSGGLTAHIYRESPESFMKAYNDLMAIVQVPLKVIHVVRNPYDIVATKLLYRLSKEKGKKANFSSTKPITDTQHIAQAVRALESEVRAVSDLIYKWNFDRLEVHNVDFTLHTKDTMRRICQFLGLECPESYLQICDDAAFDQPRKSRTVVVWNKAIQKNVDQMIHSYPFFNRYSLNGN